MKNVKLIGTLGIFIIVFLIFNRLRHREPLYLSEDFHFSVQVLLKFTCFFLILHLIINIYRIYFIKRINLNFDLEKLIDKIRFISIIQENYYIKIIKNFYNEEMPCGIYNYILYKTYALIENTIIAKCLSILFNFIVFRRPFNNYMIEANIPISLLFYNKWIIFLYHNLYYIFKFIPIFSLQLLGIVESIYTYEITVYYKLLFLFLPTFILNILITQQLFQHSKMCMKLRQKYAIEVQFVYRIDSQNPLQFYEVENLIFKIDNELSDEKLNDITTKYSYHVIREYVAAEFIRKMDSYPKLNVLLMTLSLSFLLILLYY